jgi:hypothetical protein
MRLPLKCKSCRDKMQLDAMAATALATPVTCRRERTFPASADHMFSFRVSVVLTVVTTLRRHRQRTAQATNILAHCLMLVSIDQEVVRLTVRGLPCFLPIVIITGGGELSRRAAQRPRLNLASPAGRACCSGCSTHSGPHPPQGGTCNSQ